MAGGERPVRLGIKMLTESVYDDVPYVVRMTDAVHPQLSQDLLNHPYWSGLHSV